MFDLLGGPKKKKRAAVDLLSRSKPEKEPGMAPDVGVVDAAPGSGSGSKTPRPTGLDLFGAPPPKRRKSVDLLAPSKPEPPAPRLARTKDGRAMSTDAKATVAPRVLDLLATPPTKKRKAVDLLGPSKPELVTPKQSRTKKPKDKGSDSQATATSGVVDLLGAPTKAKRKTVDLLAPSKPEADSRSRRTGKPDRSTSKKPHADLLPTESILFYGQSNAGAGGRAVPDLVTPVTDGSILTFATRPQSYGRARVDFDDMSGLGTLYDRAEAGAMGATAMAFALKSATWSQMPPDLAYFMFTVWYGDQPLSTFVRGTTAWANLMDSLTRAEETLRSAGRRHSVGALVFLQGENGPRGRAIYQAAFNELLGDLLPEIRTRTGQPGGPLCLLAQMNRGVEAVNPASGVELAQWDVARARADTVMAGPCYHLPLVDNIHHTSAGRMMLGEMLAYAYIAHRQDKQRFLPLHPIGAERDGRRIRLSFHLPEPSTGLSWDTTWLDPCEHRGFTYTDADRSAVIDDVEISGRAEVTLLLDKEPTGANKKVLYAQEQVQRSGWASARGLLINRTDHPSYFGSLGYNVPATINHYCLRSEVPIA